MNDHWIILATYDEGNFVAKLAQTFLLLLRNILCLKGLSVATLKDLSIPCLFPT